LFDLEGLGLLQKAGLTQQEVAERPEVSVCQVSRGKPPDGPAPERRNRRRVAKLYRTPNSELGLSDDADAPLYLS
jgi:transcriptional regulator with XRE-family HTH domain